MSMKETYYKYEVTFRKIILLWIFLFFTYIFINYLFEYVGPFVISFALSVMLERPVRFLHEKLRIPRGISGIFFIALIFFGIIFLGSYVVTIVGRQGISFLKQFNYSLDEMLELITNITKQFEDLFKLVPEPIQNMLPALVERIQVQITALIPTILQAGTSSVVSFVPNFFMYVILIFISGFFFIKDRDYIYQHVKLALPEPAINAVIVLRTGLFDALFGYIKAQLILMSVSAAIIILGLTILKHEYALFLGLVIALVDALPIFGSGAFFWPWALYSVISGNYPLAIGLMIIYACVFVMRQLLEPKVLSSQIGIHPIVTLMSIFAGLKIFGFLGFIIGPIIAVIAKVIISTPMEVSHPTNPVASAAATETPLAIPVSSAELKELIEEEVEGEQSWAMVTEAKGTKISIDKIKPTNNTDKTPTEKEILTPQVTEPTKNTIDPLALDTSEDTKTPLSILSDKKTKRMNKYKNEQK